MMETLTIQYSSTFPERVLSWSRPAAQAATVPARQPRVADLLLLQPTQQIYFRPSDPNYIFLQSLTLDVERADPGDFVLAEPVSGVYGAGRNLREALADLQSMIIDLYVELVAGQAELSQKLRQQLEYLRLIIQPR